jgi:serine/threonine protein phosphatase 1
MKRLVIGDIHGCREELLELLDRAGPAADDEIIAIGDLVDRGPDSPGVAEFARTTSRITVIMGNHEHKHLQIARGKSEPSLSQVLARDQFSAEGYAAALSFFGGLPLFLDFTEAVLVHGCFEPGKPLAEQRPEVLLGTMAGEAHLARHYPGTWYELYDKEKPLIAGHHDYSKAGRPLVINARVFLIDTGCCYGQALTGLILPEFRFVSVPARRNYWAQAVQEARAADRGSDES